MPVVKIKENIYAVGAVDPDVRIFHGYETPKGTTYNAYLVIDDEITLVDFVKAPFTDELLNNIREIVPVEKIDTLICNHVEPDHSGALPVIADMLPNATIYCTAAAVKGLKAYYKRDFNCTVVKKGDILNTGKYTFNFFPMPMVHWPDSMSTYLAKEKVLFSNDAFGQHICSGSNFDSELGLDTFIERCGDYYANIVLPFSTPVQRILSDVSELDVDTICPSHGVVINTYIPEIVEKYIQWSKNEIDNNKAVIVYDTMWGATKIMAQRIADDFSARGITPTLLSLSEFHHSYVMGVLLDAKYIAVGSSTLNNNMMPTVAAFLYYMKGLKPKNRVGLAFGSYGWSGESIRDINDILLGLGWEMSESIKQLYMPD